MPTNNKPKTFNPIGWKEPKSNYKRSKKDQELIDLENSKYQAEDAKRLEDVNYATELALTQRAADQKNIERTINVAYNTAKILDPTGITSYPEAINAWTDGKFTGDDIMQGLQVIPLVNKSTAIGRVGKGGKSIRALQQAMNIAEPVVDVVENFKNGGTMKKAKSGIKVTAEKWDPVSQSWINDDGSYTPPTSSIYSNSRNNGVIPQETLSQYNAFNQYGGQYMNEQIPQYYTPYNSVEYDGVISPNYKQTEFNPITNNWDTVQEHYNQVSLQPQYKGDWSNTQRDAYEASQPQAFGPYKTMKGKRKSNYSTEYDEFYLGGDVYQPNGRDEVILPAWSGKQSQIDPWQFNQQNSQQTMQDVYSGPNQQTTSSIDSGVTQGQGFAQGINQVTGFVNDLNSFANDFTKGTILGGNALAMSLLGKERDERLDRPYQKPNYNPNAYGTGSQAIAKDGLTVHSGGNAELISYNPYSPDTVQFNGASHDNGGIPISYNGTKVEVEGGETMTGNTVFGNMTVPGTNMKFKNASKQIAKEETKAANILGKGDGLLLTEPDNAYNTLRHNSGRMLKESADMKLQELAKTKQDLAMIQDVMLQHKEATKEMKNGGMIEAKKGLTLAERNNNPGNLKFDNQKGAVKGDKEFAKFNSYEDGFNAMVKDLKAKQTGRTRHNLNGNSTLSDLISIYAPESDNNPTSKYISTVAKTLGITSNTKIGKLDTIALAKAMAKFEDGAYYNKMGDEPIKKERDFSKINPDYVPPTSPTAPVVTVDQPIAPKMNDYSNWYTKDSQPNVYQQESPKAQTPTVEQIAPAQGVNRPSLADNNRLGFSDVAPEIAGILGNMRPDFVQGQEYNPTLYTPYQVSFQDRINQNNAQLNAIERTVPNNPAALATLAAQSYQANDNVLAEQFRTNQGIANDVINKNVGIVNDAELKNIGLRDQQYVRQAQADANTKQRMFEAMQSLSNKFSQKRRENVDIRLKETMFPNFRADDSGTIMLNGEPHVFDQGVQSWVPVVSKQTVTQKDGDKTTKTQYEKANNSTNKKLMKWI